MQKVKLISEINTEIDYFQLQLEEIVTKSKIPMEEGEEDERQGNGNNCLY